MRRDTVLKVKSETMTTMNKKHSCGFSLVEVMVAMVVGLIILSGVFALHSATRKTQVKNEEQMEMVADARFAIELIAFDLRHSGIWGGTSNYLYIECRYEDPDGCTTSTVGGETLPTIASLLTADCEKGWFYDLRRPVVGVTSGSTQFADCITSRQGGTDMLALRYADSSPRTILEAGQVYVRSNNGDGRIFIGDKQPTLNSGETSGLTNNHEVHAYLYYVGDYSDVPGDALPSLRRMSLVNGPSVVDQLLIPGVVDFQVAFGEDTNNDAKIDRYIDASKVSKWDKVYAAKIWLVMRTDENQDSAIDTTVSFDVDGMPTSYGGAGGFRYFMVSSLVNIRNVKKEIE
jgi:type IV pilus assembly protein PilW